jgi:hypothetical protein
MWLKKEGRQSAAPLSRYRMSVVPLMQTGPDVMIAARRTPGATPDQMGSCDRDKLLENHSGRTDSPDPNRSGSVLSLPAGTRRPVDAAAGADIVRITLDRII